MMNDWKYITLRIAGELMEFIYDVKLDKVYPKLFPGLEVQPFTSSCGMRIMPDILKKIVYEKCALMEVELQLALDQHKYESLEDSF